MLACLLAIAALAAPRIAVAGVSTTGGLAIDGARIFWSDRAAGTISSARFEDGGDRQILASGEDHPGLIAVAGTSVVWTAGRSELRRKSAGSAPVTIARHPSLTEEDRVLSAKEVSWLQLDGGSAYWSVRSYDDPDPDLGQLDDILVTPLVEGSARLLAKHEEIGQLALSADRIAFTEDEVGGCLGRVDVVPRTGGEPANLFDGNPPLFAVTATGRRIVAAAGTEDDVCGRPGIYEVQTDPTGKPRLAPLVFDIAAIAGIQATTDRIWFWTRKGEVGWVPISGGRPTIVARGQVVACPSFAGRRACWFDAAQHAILCVTAPR